MFTELDRQQLVVPFTVFAGALTIAGTEATKDEIAKWTAWSNAVVTGFQATYTDQAGTGPTLALTLERGTTVLATLTTLSANETTARSAGLVIPIFTGDLLNIKGAVNNTDNAFDGLLVILELQALASIS
jgi:hypothetical protein